MTRLFSVGIRYFKANSYSKYFLEIKLNLKFIKLKDHFNAFFVAKFRVIRKIEVVPKEVFLMTWVFSPYVNRP